MDMNNDAGLGSFEIALRTGWKDEEKLMLWDEIKKAQRIGAPLKRVFETVAKRTGRKPNSVRNYYYMKVKETGEIEKKPSTFTPFTKEEIYTLLRTLLGAAASGESIRGASLRLADGDKTLMLRYQNKYRSLIKNGRPLVDKVMADMDKAGEKYVSPYDLQKPGAIALKESRLIPESVVKALMAFDVDVKSFFKGLAKVADMAMHKKHTEEEMRQMTAQNESILKENAILSTRLKKEMEKSFKTDTLFEQLAIIKSALPEAAGDLDLKNLEARLKEGMRSNADAL